MKEDPALERKRHQDAILRLSQSLGAPLEVVRALYEKEQSLLAPQARVKEFLNLLIARRVRDRVLRPEG